MTSSKQMAATKASAMIIGIIPLMIASNGLPKLLAYKLF
jgi:Flp pilus assembly protein TadB